MLNMVPGLSRHFEQYRIFRIAIAWMSNGRELSMLEHDLSVWNTHVLSIGFIRPLRSRCKRFSRVHNSVHVDCAFRSGGIDLLTVSFMMYTELTCKLRGRAETGTIFMFSHSCCGMTSGSMSVTMICPPAPARILVGMSRPSAQGACRRMSGSTALWKNNPFVKLSKSRYETQIVSVFAARSVRHHAPTSEHPCGDDPFAIRPVCHSGLTFGLLGESCSPNPVYPSRGW